jgi:hypothetical protein
MDEKPDFKTKPVEAPILNSEVRDQLTGGTVSSGEISAVAKGGFKGFYQANKIYFWAIFFGLLIIAALAYFAFRKTPVPMATEANVNVSFADNTPQTVSSGGEMVYYIHVENKDKNTLVRQQLELVYPDGFGYLGSSPGKALNLSGTLFSVPDLISGQDASIIVKARAMGNINDSKTLIVKLHYSYNNFNSEFVKQQEFTVRLVASDVVLELSGPQSANNAQLVLYNVKYQNNSGSDIHSARVSLAYPDGFTFADAAPKPDLGNNVWSLGTIAKGAEGNIQIQGNFSAASAGESKTAVAELQILGQSGNFFVQNTSSFITAIATLPLVVSQSLNSNDNNNLVVKPGDTLDFSIKYQNNASTVATGVNVTATLNSKVLDLSTLRPDSGQVVNNNAVVWNGASVPKLARLGPNDSGELSFSVQVKDPATRDSAKNLKITSSVEIKANEYTGAFPGNNLVLKISSPSSIVSDLSLVSGSLPPQVNKLTTYKVSLSLTNSSNDYTNGVLTAFIPLATGGFDATSVNAAEASKVQFDPSTGKLTWNVGSLPAYTGKFSQARVLEFNLKFYPAASQVSQSPVLVRGISFSAKDSFTGEDVNLISNNITTADITGADNYGKGMVVP